MGMTASGRAVMLRIESANWCRLDPSGFHRYRQSIYTPGRCDQCSRCRPPHPFALSSFACAAACGGALVSPPLVRVDFPLRGEELREANQIKQRSKEPRALNT